MVLLAATVLRPEEAEMGLWFPKTEVRTLSTEGEALKDLVVQVLALPNEGGEDERFEKDLNKLDELLSLCGCFYVASARSRSLLSPQDGVFPWTSSQKEELERLRELLHPKHFSSVQGVDDNARVVQVIFYANAERDDASDLERRVLWRATHLFPVLAFCEIMVACEGTFGAAVAAKSALELLAHFVTGGEKKNKFDPFSDATQCNYTDLTKKVGLEPLYGHLCDVVHLEKDFDDETIKDLCKEVLVAVKTCEALQMPIKVWDDEEILTMKFPVETFSTDREIGNYCLVTYRTDYDDQIWPGSHETVEHAMSWSGVSSARLTQLGFDEVSAHDSPATIEAEELLKLLKVQLERSEKDTDKQRCYRAIDSLLRTTCIASNLNNIVAIGAIVRELHLTVEKLMMHEKRATETENNLDILADDLDDDLNNFRKTVHAALSSFAHPGWLIRTELLKVSRDANDKWHALGLTSNYTPDKRIVIKEITDGRKTALELLTAPDYIPLQESHWRIIGERYPEVIQKILGLGSETTQTGAGFTVPFEAFELCVRALEKLLCPLPVVVRLAYLFDATEPPSLPEHLEYWFTHESIKPVHELQRCADNTYFFSRPAREFLFPEIVELERDILETRPGVFDEVELVKLPGSAALSSEIAKRWQSAKHVALGRRSGLRRYVATHLDGVSRSANGWKVEATLSGKGWERTVESGIFWINTLEIHVFAPNLGCVVIDVAANPDEDEEREERNELTKDLAALTKDVISPNSLLDDKGKKGKPLLPVAKLKLDGSDCELTWYEVLDEVTRPFRSHERLPFTSLLNESNQEFGQYFRRLWFLPDSTMESALNCVRVNYLRPFDKGRPPKVIDVPKSSLDLDEGWCGLVHHHEFIVSGLDDPDESHGWWYREVLSGVVWQDYAWLWLLAVTKKVQLARLLGDLDLSSPRNAEVELKRFYEFMQKENFVAPSTQPMGNRLMGYLDEQTGAKRLIDEIKQEADAMRQGVIEGSVRRQGSALALIAVLGTWLALAELGNADDKLGFSELWDWVKQGAVLLSGAAILGLYLVLTKRRGRHRLR